MYRDFTPWERILTQSRVLFFYLGLLAFPHIRSFGLYHDDFVLSTGLLTPWTTLASVLLWALLAALALWGVRRRALWSFGLLWYLVGHSLESSLVALELCVRAPQLSAELRYPVPRASTIWCGGSTGWPASGVLPIRWWDCWWQCSLSRPFRAQARGATSSRWWSSVCAIIRNRVAPTESTPKTNAQRAGDLELAYAHWARAAELNPSSVLELIEMDRVLAAQILAFEDRGNSVDPSELNVAPPSHFSAPMAPDVDYLRALDRIVAGEITRRLETRPMPMGNVSALRALERCIHSKLEPCLVLYPRAVEWFELATRSSRVSERARAVLLLGLAKLYAIDKRLEEAIATAEARGRHGSRADPLPVRARRSAPQAQGLRCRGNAPWPRRSVSWAIPGFRHGVLRDLKRELEMARSTAKPTVSMGH